MNWSPDFIGIGAEKSATTWAWTILDQHPQIGMSHPKELNYFSDNFEKGSDWYRSFFKYDPERQKCGEISPLYMDNPLVAERIARCCPDAKILVMLRNPFDRAISHLFHDAQNVVGRVTTVTAETLRSFAVKDDKYLRRSLYGRQLQPFFDQLNPSNVGIFFFEDVKNDSQSLAESLYRFAEVDPGFQPARRDERVNQSTDFRFVSLTRLIVKLSRTAKALPLTRQMMQWVYRNTSMREQAIKALSVDRGKPNITFADVFSDADIDLVYSDLQILDQLIPDGCPEFWAADSPEVPRPRKKLETSDENASAHPDASLNVCSTYPSANSTDRYAA